MYTQLEKWREAYERRKRPDVPFIVTAVLAESTELVCPDPIHLDNLLCRVIVEEAVREYGQWEWSAEKTPLPCPLVDMGSGSGGLPWYAASSLYPTGEVHRDVVFLNKSAPTGGHSKPNTRAGTLKIETNKGRWMERRVVTPTLLTDRLEAKCFGDPDETFRLLSGVTHLGKRRNVGFGEVAEWVIEPSEHELLDCVVKDGRTIKPVPVTNALGIECRDAPHLVGWSPPQWKPDVSSVGWPFGSQVA